MLRFALCLFCLLAAPAHAAATDTIARLFARHGVSGTVVIAPLEGEATLIHNEARARQRFVPASTFKIFNTLIALESGAISDKHDVLRWDGQRHEFDSWNSDQTLASAFRVSCVWCYQELASRVGRDIYREQLARAAYGSLAPDFALRSFWLDGGLQVSALEQISLLRQICRHQLPFSPRSYAILKDIMRVEQTADHALYAKTGWAARSTPQIGWYVGYVETRQGTWLFATHIELRSQADLPLRQALTRAALEAAGILAQQ